MADDRFQYVKLPDGSYGKFRSDATDTQIRAAITKDFPNAYTNTVANTISKATAISPQPEPFTREWFRQGLWRMGAEGADLAPGGGAMVGGLIGGAGGGIPGSIGGAGAGGMGGEALRQLVRRYLGFPDVPQTSAEAAKDITREGVIQGGIQGVTELMPPIGNTLSKAAETQYYRALNPTTKINKAITREITPELIRRGEFGSLEGLEKRAGQRIADLTPPLAKEYTGQQVTNAGVKVLQDLDKMKQEYMPGGVVAQPQAVNAIEGIQNIIQQYGPDISDTNLRRLRQIFEEIPAERGAYSGADISTNYTLRAQEQAADSIRGILNSNPNIGRLNKEISFWLDVQRVTRATVDRRVGQSGGLAKIFFPVIGSIATGVAGVEKGGTAAAGTAAAAVLSDLTYRAMQSPLWKTVSAVGKDRFAKAIASGDLQLVAQLAARLVRAPKEGGRIDIAPPARQGVSAQGR